MTGPTEYLFLGPPNVSTALHVESIRVGSRMTLRKSPTLISRTCEIEPSISDDNAAGMIDCQHSIPPFLFIMPGGSDVPADSRP
ncbi:hypothetical protein J6590_013852 [Homalodisca vitripennis]|nr:hypothetical protein J6590_013852 [Homalodisca vitripennis]